MTPTYFEDIIVDAIPQSQGIYFWKKGYSFSKRVISDGHLFIREIKEWINSPYLRAQNLHLTPEKGASDSEIRKGLINVTSISIGGNENFCKEEQLSKIMQNPNEISVIKSIIEPAIITNSPTLYVGEAVNLQKRIQDHIGGITPLIERCEAINIDKKHLLLNYYPIDSVSKEFRTTVEELLTIGCLSPLTIRKG